MSGLQPLENWMGDGFATVIGDPIFMGLMILGFFFGFVMLQGTRLDAKLLVLVPVALLAAPFFPAQVFMILLGLACAFILYLALAKMDNK